MQIDPTPGGPDWIFKKVAALGEQKAKKKASPMTFVLER